jgi:hypothetical protein
VSTRSPATEPLGSQVPTYRNVPRYSQTAADEAIDLAAAAGLVLDPWEELALRDALGVRDDDGRWAAFQVGLIVPRQNGKGTVLEVRALAGLFLFDERLITWSAHEFKTAVEGFRRLRRLIEDNRDFERKVQIVRTAAGQEGIELRSGQRVRFMARSRGAGRGFTGDTVILDEAYNLPTEALAAVMPTMSARPNPQIWYTSSAPLATPESDVLRRICKQGRAGSRKMAYLEWCAPYGAEPDDPDALATANPGLGIRLNMDVIDAERLSLEPDDFARERLGIWRESERETVFGHGKWETCADSGVKRPEAVCFGFDLAPGKTSAAIAVAGMLDGKVFVDVAVHDEGTDWLVGELKRLKAKYKPDRIVCDELGPSGALLAKLERARIEVELVGTKQHQQACGGLFLDVVEGRLVHPDVDVLNTAVFGAVKREVGDAWLWSRKKSDVDISPLVAVTLARWAAAQAPAKRVLTDASVW